MKIIKKLVLTIALIGSISSVSAQFSVGGGLGYNDKINAPGLVVKAEVEIMENIAISPSISYFSGSAARLSGSDYKNNLFAVDVNGHYKIEIMMDELDVYPLAGLNYSSYKNGANVYFDESGFSQSTGNALGLNIGGGGRWSFSDQLSVFAELKYTISDFSQVVLGAGILYEL
ncbi:outer membrane beta-barrel protein [Aureibaculum sp. A20]|uniref:Outer membrane beta-barrel protein n=1 Tax=Aureibaculum flavum TaxID=2795986 RepID=A0ABS0WQ35_9FLAO|nr:outer membrane beta-barrel protein [Aureibaculum flavum]MBJ2173988.1 outer membrane beta-barrel protein [Aureibaculum flavum]